LRKGTTKASARRGTARARHCTGAQEGGRSSSSIACCPCIGAAAAAAAFAVVVVVATAFAFAAPAVASPRLHACTIGRHDSLCD